MTFEIRRSADGSCDVAERQKLGASLTVVKGELLQLTGGLLAKATATGKATHIALEGITTAATEETAMDVLPLSPNQIFTHQCTPLYDDQAVVSGTTTTVVFAATGSDDDMNGGECYVKELNEQRQIADSAYSGGNLTLTVTEPFTRAPAAGETVTAVPVAKGNVAHQLDGTSPSLLLGQAKDDDSGGNVTVRDIDLKEKRMEVSFNA